MQKRRGRPAIYKTEAERRAATSANRKLSTVTLSIRKDVRSKLEEYHTKLCAKTGIRLSLSQTLTHLVDNAKL